MEKTNKDPLEIVIKNLIESNYGTYEPQNSELWLKIVGQNWNEAKKHIAKMLYDGKEVFCISKILKNLKRKMNCCFDESEMREIYNHLIQKNEINKVSWLSEYTEIKPSESQLMNIWKKFFSGYWNIYELEELEKIFGKPKLSQKDVDEICSKYLRIWLGKEKTDTGMMIQPKQVKKFIEEVGIKPRWDKKTAELVYDRWLSHENLILFLQEEIGIKPNEEKVQEYYRKLLSEDISTEYIIEKLIKAVNVTGIIPKEEFVENFYRKHLGYSNVEEIKKVEKLTKIKCDEKIVNLVYLKLLKKGDIGGINLLRNKTKIKPKFLEKEVQVIYENLLRNGEVRKALHVYLFTEIEPNILKEIVIKACNQLLVKKVDFENIELLDWLLTYFEEEVTPLLQEHISKLIANEKFQTAEYLISKLNFRLKPEEKYVVLCRKGEWEKAKKLYEEYKDKIKTKYPDYAGLMDLIEKTDKFI